MLKRLPMIALAALSCFRPAVRAGTAFPIASDEPRLSNIRRLTNGGENAEAYFSGDDQKLIFQAHRPPAAMCDQIYTLDLRTGTETRVSRGAARTTCAYFYPHGDRILYASTMASGDSCPTPPSMSGGYAWPLFDYDIYIAKADGSGVRKLTGEKGYDAEATISSDGRKIVFTSLRNGDLDIYSMDADGGNVVQLTNEIGYDGGAFFSADGRQIVYRAYHPAEPEEIAAYKKLLAEGLVRPSKLEIFVMNSDGTNKRRVTHLDASSFAPFFHPNGRQIIFSSNKADPRGRNFDLYLVNLDGSGLERVTTFAGFDGFPMFTRNGRKLVFASNRGAARQGDTNLFIADWKE